DPPSETISLVTVSTGVRWCPVRKSLAPSRAKARATAPPMAPPAPEITATLSLSSIISSQLTVVIRQTDLYPRWAHKWMATKHPAVANKSRADPDDDNCG